MSTADAQNRWRAKVAREKRQLNVMARVQTHDHLVTLSEKLGLRGKAEAVDLSVFALNWLENLAEHSPEAARLVTKIRADYGHMETAVESADAPVPSGSGEVAP